MISNFLMQFDDLVEVFTDKLVAKIPSTSSGIVKEVKFEVDDVCLVGHELLSIEIAEGSGVQASSESSSEEKKVETQAPAQTHSDVTHGPGK